MKHVYLTLWVLSSSPHGSLLMKSIPVNGVCVAGKSSDASMVTYSTFNGFA